MINEPIRIRASMLPSYNDCARRAAAKQYRYIITAAGHELRELPPSIGAAIGTGSHAGATAAMIDKINGDVKLSAYAEISIVKFRQQIADGVVYDNVTSSSNDAEQQIKQLTRSFLCEAADAIAPRNVELYREASFGQGVKISGTLDIETVDGDIDDLKFGARMRPYQLQGGGYSLLKKTHDGQSARSFVIRHFPRVSKKKTYPGMQVYKYSAVECEQSAYTQCKQIVRDVQLFQSTGNRSAFPANPMSMMCSDKYCPAWGTRFCEFGGIN